MYIALLYRTGGIKMIVFIWIYNIQTSNKMKHSKKIQNNDKNKSFSYACENGTQGHKLLQEQKNEHTLNSDISLLLHLTGTVLT